MNNIPTLKKCNVCNNTTNKVIFVKAGFDLYKCDNCGLVFVGNPPSLVDLTRLYSFQSGMKSESLNNATKDERETLKKRQDSAAKIFNLTKEYYSPEAKILDVGCSTGAFIKKCVDMGYNTCGIELSEDCAIIARQRYGVDVLMGDLESDSFPQKFFDVVTMWDVIEHFLNPSEKLGYISRFLKDKGILCISTPNVNGLFPQYSLKIAKFINFWRHPEPPYHLYMFGDNSIKRLLNRHGFKIIKILNSRIPVSYTFGDMFHGRKWFFKTLHFLTFLSLVIVGPYINKGDNMIIIAKKNPSASPGDKG